MHKRFDLLTKDIVSCCKCPRLVDFRENVMPRKPFPDESYWRKPVPGFGDSEGWLLILGLAPSAHGGNRTGRIFTGDKSGQFLLSALHAAGFANKPESISREDGLELKNCYITASVKCVPPHDKPTPQEFRNCNSYLQNEWMLLKNVTHILALGGFAVDGCVKTLKQMNFPQKSVKFSHGASYGLESGQVLFMSYHPSPQNTNTGKLTEAMLVEVLERIKQSKLLGNRFTEIC